MSEPVVRWGIIGPGDVVEHKSGAAFDAVPGSQLLAVAGRTPARAEDYARRHSVPRWYATPAELIADPEIDAVYVATPPSSHHAYTLEAAAAGKHVYVEKPMGRTGAECDDMVAAAEAAGTGLYVAYYRRALPRFVAAEKALRAGRIGQLRSVQTRLATVARDTSGWRYDPQVSGGGLFVDLGSHALDWLDLLLGPLVVQEAVVDGGPVESRVDLALASGSGVPVGARWDFAAAEPTDTITLDGSDGTITLSCFGTDAPVLDGVDGPASLPTEANDGVVQQPLIANVVASIQGRAAPLSTGVSGARTSHVIDAALADHRARHGLAF